MISWTNCSFFLNLKSLKTNSKFIFVTLYFKLSQARFTVYCSGAPALFWGTPYVSSENNRQIHKMSRGHFLKNMEAVTYLTGRIARFGNPATVTSDRGTQFTSATWPGLCNCPGIEHILTTAFHSQANGMVERVHRQIKDALGARGWRWMAQPPTLD